MDSTQRCYVACMYITVCISVCFATNVSSTELLPSPSKIISSIMPSGADLTEAIPGTFNDELLANSSGPILPSGLQSPAFHTPRPTPVYSTMNLSPTPALHPTPVPSMMYSLFQTEVVRTPTLSTSPYPSPSISLELLPTSAYSSDLLHTPSPSSSVSMSQGESFVSINSSASSEILRTPTPSPSLQSSPEVPAASAGTIVETSQIMNASSSEPFLPSSTPFPPPPIIPPPFPSTMIRTEQPVISSTLATMVSAPTLLPSPSPFPTSGPQDNDTVTEKTWNTSAVVKTPPPKLTPIKCIMTLDGDCEHVKNQEREFGKAFANFIARILKVDISRLTVQRIRCGSIIVDFILQDSEDGSLAEDLAIMVDEGDFGFQFDNQTFTAVEAVLAPKPTREPKDSGGGLTFEEQKRMVYIIIASVVGFVLISSLILLIHHRARKSCSPNAQSFDIQDEPHIKLSDFNMAHTYIPRPRSIYGSRLGAEGSYYHNNGSIHRGGLHSPTPYVYADDEAIRVHYREVVDRESGSAAKRTSQDFGRSGVPELNLPRLEGVFQEGQEEDPIERSLLRPLSSRRDSDGSTVSRLSATFHGPTAKSPPTPPLPTPPPVPTPPPSPGPDLPTLDLPPPPPLPPPTPTLVREATLLIDRMSQVSLGSSSEATNSLHGDTSFLYKGCDYDPQPMGIDNPSYDKALADD